MLLARTETEIIRASPDAPAAVCPECGNPVIAKCGNYVIWHWAHRADNLSCNNQGETEWHLGWKLWALDNDCRVEVSHVPPLRADIVTAAGQIIELQSKPLAVEKIWDREDAYGVALKWVACIPGEQWQRIYWWGERKWAWRKFYFRRGPKRWLDFNFALYFHNVADDELYEVDLWLEEKYSQEYKTTHQSLYGRGRRIAKLELLHGPSEPSPPITPPTTPLFDSGAYTPQNDPVSHTGARTHRDPQA